MKTFKEWQAMGWRVHKGEKGKRGDDGVIRFSSEQVYNPSSMTRFAMPKDFGIDDNGMNVDDFTEGLTEREKYQ